MYEKRQGERLQQENEISLTIASKGRQHLNGKIDYQISKDISAHGARIQANAFLPVDTLIKIRLTLKNPPRMITAVGKVKWVRSLYADESYEAGLEFVDTSPDTIQLLADHITGMQKK